MDARAQGRSGRRDQREGGEHATTSGAKRTKVRLRQTRFGRVYNYIDDPVGVVLCQDVREFGGVWYAVKRSGEPVR